MDLPWAKKKNELSEEELLDEIKKEATEIANHDPVDPPDDPPMKKPFPPPPMLKKPISHIPMPSSRAAPISPPPMPALSTQEVAKLPLFMKVEEYDRIVSDLQTLVSSLEKMNEILQSLSRLEQAEREETDKWRVQLDTTRNLLNKLLMHMPETGKIKPLLAERKKIEQKQKFAREITGLQKDLRKVSVPVAPPVQTEKLSSDIQDLHLNVTSIKNEMNSLHDEIKRLAEAAQKKMAEEEEAKKQRIEYKKIENKKPW